LLVINYLDKAGGGENEAGGGGNEAGGEGNEVGRGNKKKAQIEIQAVAKIQYPIKSHIV
jgi:hypothetical protein